MDIPTIPLPPGPIGFVFKNFWVAFIIVTVVNARLNWNRTIQPLIAEHPEREDGYLRLQRGFLFWFNVPSALMGIGILSGHVSGVHEYFIPAVLCWYAAMAVVLAAGSVWMFSGGAERLSAFPGLLPVPATSARRIKLLWTAICARLGRKQPLPSALQRLGGW